MNYGVIDAALIESGDGAPKNDRVATGYASRGVGLNDRLSTSCCWTADGLLFDLRTTVIPLIAAEAGSSSPFDDRRPWRTWHIVVFQIRHQLTACPYPVRRQSRYHRKK